jgi:LPS-assembly protein
MLPKRRENTAFLYRIYLWFFPLLFITFHLTAQTQKQDTTKQILTKPFTNETSDTTKKTSAADSSGIFQDTLIKKIDTLNIPISRDSLDAPVMYEAQDSGVLDIKGRKFFLYGTARTKYQSLDLQASVIEIDNEKSTAKAFYTVDTAGKVLSRPKLIDGDMETESDSLFYNFKTQKGLSKSSYTKQGEMFVFAERIKKYSNDEFFASKGRFTTCNLDTPHFAFRAQKLKLVNNRWAYSGLAYPEFEGIPMPVGIPFGIYPISQGKNSGLLPPSFSVTQNFGLGLEGLGYYKVLNEYFDFIVRTNIYSYGGYAINFSPTYRKRYKYSGGARFDYQNTKINFKGDPDFVNTKTFNVAWNHTMDSKARPGTTFGANVNFSSPQYNQLVPTNSMLNFTNRITSSISYSKTWQDGKYNLNATANHDQNNETGLYNISLPNLTFTMNTIYPLQKKESLTSPKWWEKLGIGYNGQLQNQFSFFDSDDPRIKYNIGQIIDTMQWGAQHALPINLALPSMGPFQVAPSISYQERWYGQQVIKTWNDATSRVDTNINRGFFRGQEMTFGVSFQTAIFGTFNFKKEKSVQAIRHVIRPNIGINYKPDMAGKDWYEVQIDTAGNTVRTNKFQGSILPGFSEGKFGGITFNLQNNLEMKVRNKKDTTGTEEAKKIMLIDNFSINTGYNLIVDSFNLSPINVLVSTNLFQKFNITGTTTIDPYQVNEVGRRINKYVWEGGNFKLGRITTGSLAFGTRFESKKKKETPANTEQDDDRRTFITPEEEMRQAEYIRNNPSEFADFNIPWSADINYSFNFSQIQKPDLTGFTFQTFQSINVRGDFNFSPKWKMGGNIFYDVTTGTLGNVNMFITRDMHCWQMSINVTPVGLFPSFNISIFPKSGILRDLKVNRTRTFVN